MSILLGWLAWMILSMEWNLGKSLSTWWTTMSFELKGTNTSRYWCRFRITHISLNRFDMLKVIVGIRDTSFAVKKGSCLSLIFKNITNWKTTGAFQIIGHLKKKKKINDGFVLANFKLGKLTSVYANAPRCAFTTLLRLQYSKL